MKHIYLYFSKYEQLRDLSHDESFEKVSEYNSIEASYAHHNEFGRINTKDNFYHILFGQFECEGCPWCNSPCEVIKIGKSWNFGFNAYCIQCMNCGARGPTLNIPENLEQNTETFHEITGIMWCRFKRRLPWDKNFVNPYENILGQN